MDDICKATYLPLEGSGWAKITVSASVIVNDPCEVVKNAFDLFQEGSESKQGLCLTYCLHLI